LDVLFSISICIKSQQTTTKIVVKTVLAVVEEEEKNFQSRDYYESNTRLRRRTK
jgi:hypothetical protein